MEIISIKNLSKTYIVSKNPLRRLGGAVLGRGGGERFSALTDISFSVGSGEVVGIIGRNGSGKSTLLKILAGISDCDCGECDVRGTVSAILELGAGFNPEYSGIENIYLNGAINGFDRETMSGHIDDILSFAEIDKNFANMPIKTYSSGMLIRLAFASIVWLNTDIILVDEVLAVGDIRFRAKCFKKFEELKASGKTIIFVSHNADDVRRFCSRAIWLDSGRIMADGSVEKVTSEYMEYCVSGGLTDTHGDFINRYGSCAGAVKSVKLSAARYAVGETIIVETVVDIPKTASLKECGVCLSVKDRFGLDLCVLRTEHIPKAGRHTVRFEFENRFNAGEYLISVGVENRADTPISYYEYIEGAARMVSYLPRDTEAFGAVVLSCRIDID